MYLSLFSFESIICFPQNAKALNALMVTSQSSKSIKHKPALILVKVLQIHVIYLYTTTIVGPQGISMSLTHTNNIVKLTRTWKQSAMTESVLHLQIRSAFAINVCLYECLYVCEPLRTYEAYAHLSSVLCK